MMNIAVFITTMIFVIAWNAPDATGLTLAIVDSVPWLLVIPELAMEKAITARDVGDPVGAILWGGAVFCLYCALLAFNMWAMISVQFKWEDYQYERKGGLAKGLAKVQRKRKALGYDK